MSTIKTKFIDSRGVNKRLLMMALALFVIGVFVLGTIAISPASAEETNENSDAYFGLRDLPSGTENTRACGDCHVDHTPDEDTTPDTPGDHYDLLYEAVVGGGEFHAEALPSDRNLNYKDCVICHSEGSAGFAPELRSELMHETHLTSSHFPGASIANQSCFVCHTIQGVSEESPSGQWKLDEKTTPTEKFVYDVPKGECTSSCHSDHTPDEDTTPDTPGDRYDLLYEAAANGGNFHGDIFPEGSELTYQNCLPCHEAGGENSLRSQLHRVHMADSSHFSGSCFSCHEVKGASQGSPSGQLNNPSATPSEDSLVYSFKDPDPTTEGKACDEACHADHTPDEDTTPDTPGDHYDLLYEAAANGGNWHEYVLPEAGEIDYQDCVVCHRAGADGFTDSIRDTLHNAHMKPDSHFEGTCFTCHKLEGVSSQSPSGQFTEFFTQWGN